MNSVEHTCSPRLTSRSKVVKNLLLKRDLLNKGDPRHKEIKTALIIDRGTMHGVYGGGVVVGLEKLGMTETFDYATGVSCGVPDCAYFLAGQSELGIRVYFEDLIKREFINPLRLRKIVDVDYFERVLREVKPLDVRKIQDSRTELLIPVTETSSGKGEILSSKDNSIDLITAVKASVALPILYNRPVRINGAYYFDGGVAFPLLVEHMVQRLGCTDILVIINHPCGFLGSRELSIYERIAARIFFRNQPEFRSAFLERGRDFSTSMEDLWNNKFSALANIGIICPDDRKIGAFEKNTVKLRALAEEGTKQILEAFL